MKKLKCVRYHRQPVVSKEKIKDKTSDQSSLKTLAEKKSTSSSNTNILNTTRSTSGLTVDNPQMVLNSLKLKLYSSNLQFLIHPHTVAA